VKFSVTQLPYDAGADDPRGWMWLALSVAALALLASGVGIHNGFAYDDRWIIVQNANAHSLNRPWELFGTTYWPTTRGASLYRPLTILLYAFQWVFGGGAPFLYHFVNISLYVVDSVLVLLLGLQCLPRSGAWVAAALFAVHPVHVEAVANVVGQAELWTGLVLLSAVLVYVRERQGGVELRRGAAVAIVALYVAGMLIKENAIVLPALLVIAELFLVRDTRPWRERADKLFSLLLWMAMFAFAFLWVRTRVTGEIGGDTEHPALRNLSMGQRSLLMLGLVPEFGRLFVWPDHMSADYSPRMVPGYMGWHTGLIPGALLLLCLAILLFVSWRRAPVVVFGMAWLVVAISPVANILIPSGILIAERTLLVPSVGVMLAIGTLAPWVIAQLSTKTRIVRIAAAGAFAAVLTMGIGRSAERTYTWKDSDTVFNTLAIDAPLSFKAHYVAGGMMFDEHHAREAEIEWLMAIKLMPDYYAVRVDLAHKYRDLHHCNAAIPLYQKALEIEPALPLARIGLDICYLELAQYRKARTGALMDRADGYSPGAFRFVWEIADSALVATDSGGGINQWNFYSGHHRGKKP
jgi:protein O-mannosyl-transferase